MPKQWLGFKNKHTFLVWLKNAVSVLRTAAEVRRWPDISRSAVYQRMGIQEVQEDDPYANQTHLRELQYDDTFGDSFDNALKISRVMMIAPGDLPHRQQEAPLQISCITDCQYLSQCISGGVTLTRDVESGIDSVVATHLWWRHMGFLAGGEQDEYVIWRPRARNTVADALCHCAEKWDTAVLWIPGENWFTRGNGSCAAWCDGGFNPYTRVATAAGIILYQSPEQLEPVMLAAWCTVCPSWVGTSLMAEALALQANHQLLSAWVQQQSVHDTGVQWNTVWHQ